MVECNPITKRNSDGKKISKRFQMIKMKTSKLGEMLSMKTLKNNFNDEITHIYNVQCDVLLYAYTVEGPNQVD